MLIAVFAQNKKETLSSVRFDQLRLNEANIESTTKWHIEIVGMEIIPSSDDQYIYVAETKCTRCTTTMSETPKSSIQILR